MESHSKLLCSLGLQHRILPEYPLDIIEIPDAQQMGTNAGLGRLIDPRQRVFPDKMSYYVYSVGLLSIKAFLLELWRTDSRHLVTPAC